MSKVAQKKRAHAVRMIHATLLTGLLLPVFAFGQAHEVPGRKQDKPDNCGPTALTSCVGWFQNHGYPDLRTRDGKNGLDDLQKQIDKDSRSSEREPKDHERTVDELGHALEKLLKGGPYEKRLNPGKPGPTDLKDYRYLDTEFSHGEDIILLIRFGDNQGHFLTVRNITTNASGGRTIEYMDPADGNTHQMDVTVEGGKLKLTYDGKKGYIENALTLSPVNTTESTEPENIDPAAPGAGKKVTYRPYFPAYSVPKDLHILVSDCDIRQFTVAGLPTGWSVTIQRIGGNCYLTFNRGSATTDLTSGQRIEVVYRGKKKFARRDHALIQTSDGGATMTAPITDDPGEAIADSEVQPPDRVEGVICSIRDGGEDGRYGVRLRWHATPRAVGYVIRETYGRIVLGRTTVPEISLELLSDTLYSLTVAAELEDPDITGPASDPVVVHRDRAFGMVSAVGGQQTLTYVSPLTSWHRPYSWQFTIPGADQEVRISVTAVVGDLDPPLPATIGKAESRWYHFASGKGLHAGKTLIEIPYGADENHPRLYALSQGDWTDVTVKIDENRRMISGSLSALGTVAILDANANRSGRVWWMILVAVVLSLLAIKLAVRSGQRPLVDRT